jgi:hypothetical protein
VAEAAGAEAAGAEPVVGEAVAGEPVGGVSGEPGGAVTSGAEALRLPIEELSLPLRAYNSLRREGVHTVADLTARTPQQLLAIDNIGPASIEEIRQRLAARGLSLAESAETAGGGTAVTTGTAGATGTGEPGIEEVLSANGSGGPAAAFPAAAAGGGGPAAGGPMAGGPATGSPATASAPAAAARPTATPAPAAWQPDDDAVDLLSVAGLPVLKRVIPVAAGLVTVAVAILVRRRLRRSRS